MKILNKLTIKHLTLNKKRTITTIIGICLSTALMVGIGLIFSSVRENQIRASIHDDGRFMIKLIDVDSDKLTILDNSSDVKDYYYYRHLGYSKLDKPTNVDKPYIDVIDADENFLKELDLLEGRLPKTKTEVVISKSLITEGNYNVKIGDVITLNIGDYSILMEDKLEEETKQYTVVGICEKYVIETFSSIGYQIYSLGDFKQNTLVTAAFINLNKPKDAYKLGKSFASIFEIDEENIIYNNYLLSMYGASKYDNIMKAMMNILGIILSLVSIGCIMVIYNSFAISVMERKKQFGLFASIGTTKKQLRHTVYFEALVVGIIGIILGIMGAYVGIGVVIYIINQLLPNAFSVELSLATYPLFVIIPLIFICLTIFISAILPSRSASRTSPISAIKQNDDIKISGKKVKTRKWITKLFGIEGDIALKNIKRNKKKYRITIVSLFISIVLFISFSSLLKFGMSGTNDYLDMPDYNFYVNVSRNDSSDDNSKLKEIRTHYQVEKSMLIEGSEFMESKVDINMFADKDIYDTNLFTRILAISDEDYNNLINKYHAKEGTSFIINKYEIMRYENNSRRKYNGKIFNDSFNGTITFYDYDEKEFNINNMMLIDESPFGINVNNVGYIILTILTNSNRFEEIRNDYYGENTYYTYGNDIGLYIYASKYDDLDKELKSMKANGSISYENIEEYVRTYKNVQLVIKILLYGFISLVTLIGVTSVFNTINTSINLRRKEFAVLRSIGLSPRGFNKMLYFESIFFGLKSLLYSIPVSIGVSYLIYRSIDNMVEGSFSLPLEYILIAVIGVFIIVLLTMLYSSRKIKHENILDAIREENI